MKSLHYLKRNHFDWQEGPEPSITQANQALVKPIAIARCDLDIPIIEGSTLFRPPFALGHEFIAEVVELSEDLTNKFQVGQRVAVLFQVSCGNCPQCAVKANHHCDTSGPLSDFGMGPGGQKYGGALSPVVAVPYASTMLVPISDDDDPVALASLTDNMTDAYRTVAPHLHSPSNRTVLVAGGLGRSIAMYTIIFAKALGAEKVTFVSENKADCDFASNIGAEIEHVVKRWPTRLHEHDISVDASGHTAGLGLALRSTRREGVATAAAIYFNNKTPVPFMEMYNKGVHFYVGRTNAAAYTPEVLRLIRQNEIDLKSVVTLTADLKDAKEAWAEPSIKLVVTQN